MSSSILSDPGLKSAVEARCLPSKCVAAHTLFFGVAVIMQELHAPPLYRELKKHAMNNS